MDARLDTRGCVAVRLEERAMTILKWALIFLVFSLIAGALGFTGAAGAAMGIARVLFFLFLVLFVLFVVLGAGVFERLIR